VFYDSVKYIDWRLIICEFYYHSQLSQTRFKLKHLCTRQNDCHMSMFFFKNPNDDTEWNDVLRSKGILPPKKEVEITEDQIVDILEQSVAEKSGNFDY